jgi:hypothetical protein
VERAGRVIFIVQADRLARTLGTTFSEMLAEVEQTGSSSVLSPGSG